MTKYEKLSMLVSITHPQELLALQWVRSNQSGKSDDTFFNTLMVFLGYPNWRHWMTSISPDQMQKIQKWIIEGNSIINIASKSSNETIKEAYEDYKNAI